MSLPGSFRLLIKCILKGLCGVRRGKIAEITFDHSKIFLGRVV